MFAKCFARIILQYVPEGSGSWKYNHYFPVAEGEGKTSHISPMINTETQFELQKFGHSAMIKAQ